MKFLYL